MAVECIKETSAKKGDSTQTGESSLVKEQGDASRGSRNKRLGSRGERCAAEYLRRRDFDILETNWRCKFGEADIIAIEDDNLVFVEVKTRSSGNQGFPSEAVDKKKRDKYEKIALCYLEKTSFADMPVRFDVVSVVRVDENRALLRHHVNAFGVE